MPLPLTVSCFSKIQIGFAFLVPAHPGSPGQRAIKRVCVCVLVSKQFAVCRDFFRYVAQLWMSTETGLEGINHHGRLTKLSWNCNDREITLCACNVCTANDCILNNCCCIAQ